MSNTLGTRIKDRYINRGAEIEITAHIFPEDATNYALIISSCAL